MPYVYLRCSVPGISEEPPSNWFLLIQPGDGTSTELDVRVRVGQEAGHEGQRPTQAVLVQTRDHLEQMSVLLTALYRWLED